MPSKYPYAVRLIGFDDREADKLSAAFAADRERQYGYFRLEEDNLQEPDLFIANADDIRALAKLSYFSPSDIRPALLVGEPSIALPYPRIPRPWRLPAVFSELDILVERRAEALSRLEASAAVKVPERRRQERLDIDLTDPAEYENRRRAPADGGVLVIDKTAMLRDFLLGVLKRYDCPVAWAREEEAAADYCKRQKVALVLINTSTPGVDPYRLSEQIKRMNAAHQTSVVMLTGKPFVYDAARARFAGCDGFLNKPLAVHHLVSLLKKFLPPLQDRSVTSTTQ
ncbi:MAG: response regulator [Burkholderiales bacterium]|nr:response regulator [Burkholderiales bacterium]